MPEAKQKPDKAQQLSARILLQMGAYTEQMRRAADAIEQVAAVLQQGPQAVSPRPYQGIPAATIPVPQKESRDGQGKSVKGKRTRARRRAEG